MGAGDEQRLAIGSGCMACVISVSTRGYKAQKAMCPTYLAGLIGPGDRKSVQLVPTRSGEIPYDLLHRFVNADA